MAGKQLKIKEGINLRRNVNTLLSMVNDGWSDDQIVTYFKERGRVEITKTLVKRLRLEVHALTDHAVSIRKRDLEYVRKLRGDE